MRLWRAPLSLCSPAKAGAQFRRRTGPRLPPGNILVLIASLLLTAPAFAQSSLPPARYAYTQLEDPKQEAKAKALMETLRCLVCQGQSIADSDAEMAGDMRAFVRESIREGRNPEQVRAWLIERYGAWVSYKPPVEPLTWPLWAAPVVLLLGGFWLARGRFRRRSA
ncbi:MAG: cytochrome c-type biosis protein CcmH [Sphingomonadales bacterium]|nr:cytochrome c-type biosis protein CcmH [Sphingomonadales bacterium]